MDNANAGISCTFYTVKQLAVLFGKSEDAIRRWKNEGLGRDEDNIKLRAVEREDADGRKNSRHLVFSREAVIEFVRANPFLMDEAPQLAVMMQAEGAWSRPVISGEPDFDVWADDADEPDIPFGWHCGRVDVEERGEFTPPVFERRGRRRSDSAEALRRRLRAEAGFDEDPLDDYFREEQNKGWKNPMPVGDRRAADAELRRRKEVVYFVLGSLREHIERLENERQELTKAESGLWQSGLDERMTASLFKIVSEKQQEIFKQTDMLEEFIDVIDAELEDA